MNDVAAVERQQHQQEVLNFLHKNLSLYEWKFSLPHGTGRETYIAHGFKRNFFVKVNVDVERYLAMADMGLTPPVFVHGRLESGLSVIVQPFVAGKTPSPRELQERLPEVAEHIRIMHGGSKITQVLKQPHYSSFQDSAGQALERLQQKWQCYRKSVPATAQFVDDQLTELSRKIRNISGDGLIASHGDICNGNWLFTSDGRIYILDLESMSRNDPALDMGALLWWYYPPEMRQQFLEIAGYPYDENFKYRMQVRMAIHCLDVLLPREGSFDRFTPDHLEEALEDFKAIMAGKENPQGYDF